MKASSSAGRYRVTANRPKTPTRAKSAHRSQGADAAVRAAATSTVASIAAAPPGPPGRTIPISQQPTVGEVHHVLGMEAEGDPGRPARRQKLRQPAGQPHGPDGPGQPESWTH